MSSLKTQSLLQDTDKATRYFKWTAVWDELQREMAIMVEFLGQVLPHSPKWLICFIISLILKWRSPKMGLVQRVVSILLYGNGANKQVSKLLLLFVQHTSRRYTVAFNLSFL